MEISHRERKEEEEEEERFGSSNLNHLFIWLKPKIKRI
jgi:hypothetical protein